MPAIAPAALAMIRPDTRFTPEMSTTEYVIVTSTAPTYGLVSPEASVETSSFGTPTGSACIAPAAIDEPPEPPSARIPSSRPSACRRPTSVSAPRHMAATAAPRSPASASAATSAPPARATSSRPTSGSRPTGSGTPASTTSTAPPAPRRRARRKAYSTPFVSSVPRRTTVATGPPILNRAVEQAEQAQQQADREEQEHDEEPGRDARVAAPRPVRPEHLDFGPGAVCPVRVRGPVDEDGDRGDERDDVPGVDGRPPPRAAEQRHVPGHEAERQDQPGPEAQPPSVHAAAHRSEALLEHLV